jgi:hypothetical protein
MHFFSDFLFQPPKVPTFRGNLPRKVVTHCLCYAIPFFLLGVNFMVMAFTTHFLIDLCTDNILGKLWRAKRARWHMLVVGFDQSLHIALLFFIYWLVGVDFIVYNSLLSLFR